MANSFQRRGLRKAARILGGGERLRQFLDASPAELAAWMTTDTPVPLATLLLVVEFLADMEAGAPDFTERAVQARAR